MQKKRTAASASKSRFLLALSLSTVTAAAVAAPLAIQAVRVNETAEQSSEPASVSAPLPPKLEARVLGIARGGIIRADDANVDNTPTAAD